MMNRWLSVTFGIGLIFVWMAGVVGIHTSHWLPWMDLLVGLSALVIAGAMDPMNTTRSVGGPTFLSIALFVLGAIGMVSNTPVWLPLWNLGIGFGFLVLALLAFADAKQRERTQRGEQDKVSPRKVA